MFSRTRYDPLLPPPTGSLQMKAARRGAPLLLKTLLVAALLAVSAGLGLVQASSDQQEIVDRIPSGSAAVICEYLTDNGVSPSQVLRQNEGWVYIGDTTPQFPGALMSSIWSGTPECLAEPQQASASSPDAAITSAVQPQPVQGAQQAPVSDLGSSPQPVQQTAQPRTTKRATHVTPAETEPDHTPYFRREGSDGDGPLQEAQHRPGNPNDIVYPQPNFKLDLADTCPPSRRCLTTSDGRVYTVTVSNRPVWTDANGCRTWDGNPVRAPQPGHETITPPASGC